MDLPTYTNIWRIEKRLYKLYDFRLPMPLPINWILVFTGITLPYIVLLIAIGLPFSHTLIWLYVLPPGLLTWLTTRPVIEGKRLPELLQSQVRYLAEPRTWVRLTPLAEKDQMVVSARVWRGRPAAERVGAAMPAAASRAAAAPARAAGPGRAREKTRVPALALSAAPAPAPAPVGARDQVRDHRAPARRAARPGGGQPLTPGTAIRPRLLELGPGGGGRPTPALPPPVIEGVPVRARAGAPGAPQRHGAPLLEVSHDRPGQRSAPAVPPAPPAPAGPPAQPVARATATPTETTRPAAPRPVTTLSGVSAGNTTWPSPARPLRPVRTTPPPAEPVQFAPAPLAAAPAEPAPVEVAPADLAPPQAQPEQTPPEQAPPELAAPEQVAPEQAAPIEVAPSEAAPIAASPVLAAPPPPAPVLPAPPAAAPPETAPAEASLVEAPFLVEAPSRIEAAQVEVAPVEAAPVQAAPVEAAPLEAPPVETAPPLPAPIQPPAALITPAPPLPPVDPPRLEHSHEPGPAAGAPVQETQNRVVPSVERALSGPAREQNPSWHGKVKIVTGAGASHGPGARDQEALDRNRARLDLAEPRRILILGCSGGAGQTVTALMTGYMLASLREHPVSVVDLHDGALARYRAPAAWLDEILAGRPPQQTTSARPDGLNPTPKQNPARLDVIASHQQPRDGDEIKLAVQLNRHYPLTVLDPGPAFLTRLLKITDQLAVVVPANAEAAGALADTRDWLDNNGHAELAMQSVTVINGVSRRSLPDVEHAESIARGRSRAIVRIPWDDMLPVAAAGPSTLRPQTRVAYTALAGVLVAGLAAVPVRKKQ